MKFDFQQYLVKLFNNPLGRWYLGVPKRKKIYKITQSSCHYYTGELSKNPKGLGLPIICTGNCSPGGKFVFNRIMKLAKVIAVFAFIPLFPKNLLPLVALTDTGFQPATGLGGYGYNDWADPTNGYACNDSNSAIADAQGEKQELIPDFMNYCSIIPVQYLKTIEKGQAIISLKNIKSPIKSKPHEELRNAKIFYDVPTHKTVNLEILKKQYGPQALKPIQTQDRPILKTIFLYDADEFAV